ncbi:MAG: Crp/Fnr family transcriptional regulator [Pseudomonadota bacterium]
MLDELDAATRALLESKLAMREFGAGEQIVSYQAVEQELCFLLEGSARVKIFSETGRVVEYRTLHEGDMFGEVALIDGGARSASVVAETDCRVGRLSREEFWALTIASPDFNRVLLTRLSMLVRTLTERVLEYSIFPGSRRVFRELVRMIDEEGYDGNSAVIDPAPTHQVMADRISFHREAVSRQMSALNRMGLVKKRNGRLNVTDVEALRQLASETDER